MGSAPSVPSHGYKTLNLAEKALVDDERLSNVPNSRAGVQKLGGGEELPGRLASQITPFVPTRVARAYARGHFNDENSGDLAWPPQPRAFAAAVLLVDVSGFTALSEAYSRQGSRGCEEFSLFMSGYLSHMAKVIRYHGGDIDCFAGDALLVAFPADASGSSPGEEESEDGTPPASTPPRRRDDDEAAALSEAVQSAIECLLAICSKLNCYQGSPDSPTILTIHAALASGTMYAVECGGEASLRSEAFMLGKPLAELKAAIDETGPSELALAPSAVASIITSDGLAAPGGVLSGADNRSSGCAVIPLPRRRASGVRSQTARSSSWADDSDTYGAGEHETPSLSSESPATHPSIDVSADRLPAVRLVAQRAHRIRDRLRHPDSFPPSDEATTRAVHRVEAVGEPMGGCGCCPSFIMTAAGARRRILPSSSEAAAGGQLSLPLSALDIGSQGRHSSDDSLHAAVAQNDEPWAAGLDALFRFVPAFVRERIGLGLDLSSLAENREVTVVFIVGCVQLGDGCCLELIGQLQGWLGRVIDLAEVQLGGATRQVTMDEKGLAGIFVFGLPGITHSRDTSRAGSFAVEVVDTVDVPGLSVTAGMARGGCYCGLVGDCLDRCEYCVMGDTVNTAARLAGKAAKLSRGVICDQVVKDAITTQGRRGRSSGLGFDPLGPASLKGKDNPVEIFQVVRDSSSSPEASQPAETVRVVGRQAETAAVLEALDDTSAVPVVCVTGGMGMGKTQLLDHLQAVIRDGQEQRQGTANTLRAKVGSSVEFGACQHILAEMLQSAGTPPEGARKYCALEAGRMSTSTQEELPTPLQPFHQDILDVHGRSSGLLKESFCSLYQAVLAAMLSCKPQIILVDDVGSMDSLSVAVLKGLVRGSRDQVYLAQSGIVLASAASITSFGRDDVTAVPLGRLGPTSMALLAREVLGSSSLDNELHQWIIDQSQGSPLYVTELCHWLMSQCLVSVDANGSAMLRGRLGDNSSSAGTTPPTLQGIIQAHLDRLPPVLQTVLRCASILGGGFEKAVLYGVLPPKTLPTPESLDSAVEALLDAQFLEPIGSPMWRFSRRVHQEMLHNSVLHRHRLQIHRRAAHGLEGLLQESPDGGAVPGDYSTRWQRQAQLAFHWMQILKGSSGKSGKRLTGRDLRSAAQAVSSLVSQRMRLGQFSEAAAVMEELYADVKLVEHHTNDWANEQLEMLHEQILLIQTCLFGCGDDPEQLARVVACHRHMIKLQEDLQRQTSSSSTSGDFAADLTGPTFRQKRQSAAKYSRLRCLGAMGKMAPIYAKMLSHPSRMLPDGDVWSLSDLYSGATCAETKILFGTAFAMASFSSTVITPVAAVAASTWQDYVEAGRPDIKIGNGTPCPAALGTCWNFCATVAGELHEPTAHSILWDSLPALISPADLKEAYIIVSLLEAFWEPPHSGRISKWAGMARQIAQTTYSAPTQVEADNKHLEAKKDMLVYSNSLTPHLHQPTESASAGDRRASSAEAGAAAQASWASLMGQLAPQVQGSATWKTEALSLARACTYEGCRTLMGPAGDGLRGGRILSRTGVLHLQAATGALSDLLAYWGRRFLLQRGASCMPATWLYFQAMRHWFQWILRSTGEGPPAPVAFPGPVRGWQGGTSGQRAGPGAVCSGLLLAQAMSVADAPHVEFISSCLPATVALARLLCGKAALAALPDLPTAQPGPGLCDRESECWVFVPLEPEMHPVPAEPQPQAPQAILSARVRLGSPEAVEVGVRHLERVLARVQVEGGPLALDDIRGPCDVADSETVFEAVCVLRMLKEEIRWA